MRAALSRAPSQSGWSWARIAAAPATWGVAIDVPELAWYESGPPGSELWLLRAAVMSTPGAVMSGLRAEFSTTGPRLDRSARASALSTAPTVSADGALPGD